MMKKVISLNLEILVTTSPQIGNNNIKFNIEGRGFCDSIKLSHLRNFIFKPLGNLAEIQHKNIDQIFDNE